MTGPNPGSAAHVVDMVDHLETAKRLADAEPDRAHAHALIAIAEQLQLGNRLEIGGAVARDSLYVLDPPEGTAATQRRVLRPDVAVLLGVAA